MSVADSIISEVRARIARLDAKAEGTNKSTSWARAMLAKLRRGIGKELGETPDILEITIGGLPDELRSDEAERAIHTALTLYALHRQGEDASMHSEAWNNADKSQGNSFGKAVGRLRKSDGSNESAVKRRFDAVLTAQDLTELSRHARALIQLIRASDVPIKLNYARFAKDLYDYCDPDARRRVRLDWGGDFYRQFKPGEQAETLGGE